jgi:hypothetical protein
MKIFCFLRCHLCYILLIAVVIALFAANYQLGTRLAGWDNLQTELNPGLAVKRAILAVWEEHQSFGLVSGMAHASDLVRSLFLWIVSFILPQNTIRYFFYFLMLAVGTTGVFKLFESVGMNKEKRVIAFIAALFYLFNLGSVQMNALPYEPFLVFFAFLPWEAWIFIRLLSSSKYFVLFLLINLLATPQAYLQTIFFVYILILGCIFLGILISSVKKKAVVRKALFLFALIFVINSFWILPQMYFLKTSGDVIQTSKTNLLATEDVFFQNREKGTLDSFVKLEGFYYDLYNSQEKQFFEAWKNHFAKPFFQPLPYLFAFIVILGFLNKKPYRLSFIFSYLLITIALLNATFPFSEINDLLRNNTFINQIFRSPFTKFIIPASLVTSYFFASGIDLVITLISRISKKLYRPILYLCSFVFLTSVILYALPVFDGQYLSPEMKVRIPEDYLELIEYFKGEDKNKRIALLPDYTFWGWFFHQWGYNGSGFLWYGIEQPITSRTFDVWSAKSESFFWENKTALEAEDLKKFNQVLEKYRIDYIVLDHSLLPVSSTLKGMQYERINTLLAENMKTTLVKKWQYFSLYRVKHNQPIDNFITVKNSLPNIGPIIRLTNEDNIYADFGDYQTNPLGEYDYYYPFLDLTTQTRVKGSGWKLEETTDNFIVSRTTDFDFSNYELEIPSVSEPFYLYKEKEVEEYQNTLKYLLDGRYLTVFIKKLPINSFALTKAKVTNLQANMGKIEEVKDKRSFSVKAVNGATASFGYDAPYLEQRYGYLVKIDNLNLSGRRLFFYIMDLTKKQSYLEDRLINDNEYYILNPKYQWGLGYNFVFQGNSYKNIASENLLNDLTIYTFPYQEIKNVRLVRKDGVSLNKQPVSAIQTRKINYFTYEAVIPENLLNQNNTLILYQAFSPGWKAYITPHNTFLPFVFGQELKDHTTVNNWANGWFLNSESTVLSQNKAKITLVFWPQYLEFLGLGLLFLLPLLLFIL